MGSLRSFVIWSLIVALSLPVRLVADEPTSARSTDATTITPAAASADTPAKPKAPNLPDSVGKIVELEKLIELTENPDWLLVIGGIAIAFWGTNQLTGDVGNLLTSSLPAAVKLSRLVKILKLGDETGRALTEMAADLKSVGGLAKRTADALKAHLDSVPEGLAYRPSLQGKRPDEVRDALARAGVRERISQDPRGEQWLRDYDRLNGKNTDAQRIVMDRFIAGISSLEALSQKANDASRGYFRMEELAHKPVRFSIKPMEYGPAGAFHLHSDGGFLLEANDPSQIYLLGNMPATRCAEIMAKVRTAYDKNVVAAKTGALFGPASHLGVIALGYSLYRLGANLVRNRTQSSPNEIIAAQKSQAQQEVVRELIRTGEITNVADLIREYRRAGKDADVKELYKIFREILRKRLPSIAQQLRGRTDAMLREKADFEGKLWSFLQDDEAADAILDSALAEAAQAELKTTNPDTVFGLMFSNDSGSQPQIERLLMRHYGTTVKYLWPTLSVDGSAIPVDASVFADAVGQTASPLGELSKARKKRLGLSAESIPLAPAHKPAAAVSEIRSGAGGM